MRIDALACDFRSRLQASPSSRLIQQNPPRAMPILSGTRGRHVDFDAPTTRASRQHQSLSRRSSLLFDRDRQRGRAIDRGHRRGFLSNTASNPPIQQTTMRRMFGVVGSSSSSRNRQHVLSTSPQARQSAAQACRASSTTVRRRRKRRSKAAHAGLDPDCAGVSIKPSQSIDLTWVDPIS